MFITKDHVVKLLSIATVDTKKKVYNKYVKNEYLTEDIKDVFGTNIHIKLVYIATKKGLFMKTFELAQMKFFLGIEGTSSYDEIYFGSNSLVKTLEEISLGEDKHTILNKNVKRYDVKLIADVLKEMEK